MADLVLVVVGEIAIAYEEPDNVGELLSEGFCRLDNEVVAFEHEQARDGDQHDGVFGDIVFRAE